jgi:hypothetical protein
MDELLLVPWKSLFCGRTKRKMIFTADWTLQFPSDDHFRWLVESLTSLAATMTFLMDRKSRGFVKRMGDTYLVGIFDAPRWDFGQSLLCGVAQLSLSTKGIEWGQWIVDSIRLASYR